MTFVLITFIIQLDDWREALQNSFRYELVPLTFPEPNQEEWKTLFKPCAAQRLFLPVKFIFCYLFQVYVTFFFQTLLSHIDSVLYLDTDTLFLSSASDIWKLFQTFNESQIVGLSPEHEDKNVGWYNRFARHPFYGELGVNSGVMLMNLTRMRQFGWEEKIFPIYKEYKLKIIWGDQDLINILFHFHPEKLLVFPCEWNYRPDHCMYMSVCNTSGIRIIHGNRGYFHSDKQPIFKYLYNAISEYQLNDEPYRHFLLPLEISLKDIAVVSSNCGKVTDKFLYKAKQIFKENLYDYNSE